VERNARPIKKINPYDCFRSGEARESIVKTAHVVEREVAASVSRVPTPN